jgi:hypothetical protein
MNIPVNDYTRNAQVAYVESINRDHIRVVNASGGSITQGDLVIVSGRWVGIADMTFANGAEGTIHVEEGILIQTMRLLSGTSTFATLGQTVWFKPSTKEFSDEPLAGFYPVGALAKVKDADGMIKFEKFRYTEIWNTSGNVETEILEFPITADATGTLSTDFGFSFTIIDAWVQCTTANASGTATVKNNAGTAISNAMIMAVDHTIVHAGTIDEDVSAITDGIVKVTTNGAADRGIVRLLVKHS